MVRRSSLLEMETAAALVLSQIRGSDPHCGCLLIDDR